MTDRAWRLLAARRTPLLVFAWSRVNPLALAAIALAIGGAVLLTPRSYAQPFSYNEVKVSVAPLATALPALLLGLAFTNNMSTLEVRAPRKLILARLAWATAVIVTVTAATTATAGIAEPQWRAVILRNSLGLCGLALIASTVAGSRIAWAAVFAPTAAMFTAGRDGTTGEVRDWAILLAPSASLAAGLSMTILAAAGIALYTFLDSRPSTGVLQQ